MKEVLEYSSTPFFVYRKHQGNLMAIYSNASHSYNTNNARRRNGRTIFVEW